MNEQIKSIEKQITELKTKLTEARRNAEPEEVDNYTFKKQDGNSVSLAELFGDKQDLLLIHNMGRKCVYCTLWADGFSSFTPHLENRAAFVLCSPDSPQVQREFATSRDWRFNTVSAEGTSFFKDMGFEPEPGKHWPGVSAFRKHDDGSIVRTGSAMFGPGDDFCSAWHLFDLLEGGAGDWGPKYEYA